MKNLILVICCASISFVIFVGASCSNSKITAEPSILMLDGDLRLHDPSIIKEKETYYIFATSPGRGRMGIIPIHRSNDLHRWTICGYVFDNLPDWATKEIPQARGAWAPDISYYNGLYHLYYSISTFGKNDSAVGLAVNKTLDPNSPAYKWLDKGMVVRSYEGKTDWNAIDPQLAIQDKNNIWLCWGSFWGGIMMRRIDPKTGKLSAKDTNLYNLARRPRTGPHETPPAEGAIEAPFIIKHNGYWYLFVSFDFCCRGAKSTYNVVVGRSRRITGPYVDKNGKPMLEGGGTLVIAATTENWRGPGHEAVLQEPGQDYLVFHAYSGKTGTSYLQISTIVWENGWPRAGELP